MIFIDELYVDNTQAFCNLTTDAENLDELHNFANKIGLDRAEFVSHFSMPHYRLTKEKKEQALKTGAIARTTKEQAQFRLSQMRHICPDCGWYTAVTRYVMPTTRHYYCNHCQKEIVIERETV